MTFYTTKVLIQAIENSDLFGLVISISTRVPVLAYLPVRYISWVTVPCDFELLYKLKIIALPVLPGLKVPGQMTSRPYLTELL